MGIFLEEITKDPGFGMTWIGIVAFSICVHEYAHAITAYRCGDDTAAEQGHLTLNPAVQMGLVSIIMLFLIGIAWGSVPVNEGNFRKRKFISMVSFAGPASNLLLCALFGLLATLASKFETSSDMIIRFFSIGSLVNGTLFVLNMLPFPPLDGWSILRGFFPAMDRVSPVVLQNISWLLLILILLTPALSFVWDGGAMVANIFLPGFLNQ